MTSLLVAALAMSGVAPAPAAVTVLKTYDAPEATQGVAVDKDHFYAITNRRIGKYKKSDGTKVAAFEDPGDGGLIHMNGGIVHNGKLYAFHSNFPETPMVSSIEVFDLNLKHERSVSLGITRGSLVWAIPHQGNWLVCYGHYNERGGEPGMTNDFSRIDILDKDFKVVGGYGFDSKIVERWDGMTCSGGIMGPDGFLYATGHHAPEIHKLQLPKAGGKITLVEVIPSPCEGQGITYDPTSKTLWQIQRKERKVYQLQINE